ncbi:TetR/AcrR family transcriptional regulator [Nocardia beijingensis]|nr:TetR/AcrR family transcriptional regulator [Nocardia beijingensis]
MRGVCRRAGLTTRYFYENFGTRDELLDLLYRQVCADSGIRCGVIWSRSPWPVPARACSRPGRTACCARRASRSPTTSPRRSPPVAEPCRWIDGRCRQF